MSHRPEPTTFDPGTNASDDAQRAWRDWVAASFPGLRSNFPTPGRASGRGVKLGRGRLWEIHTPGRSWVRGRGTHASSLGLFAAVQLSGSLVVSSKSSSYEMQAGQVVIGRAGDRPVEMTSDAPMSFLMFELPWAETVSRHRELQGVEMRLFDSDDPGAAPLRETLTTIARSAPGLDALQRRIAETALIQLMSIPLAGRLKNTGHAAHAWRVHRALSEIASRLHDPLLEASSVAAAQQMSRRRLDELFVQVLGMPVSASIVDARMRRAAALLLDGREAGTVTEIALSVGYQDIAHFSRAFKRRWRRAPTVFRAQGVGVPEAEQSDPAVRR